jgi:putative chitinase
MAVEIAFDQIVKLAPNARSSYRDAFSSAQPVLDRYEISVSPLRVAHFMAQVLHESGGLTIQFENLNYSPERLPKVWPSRFKPQGPLDPVEYAHNPEKLASEVYGRRMGNNDPGDGFKYRGRGLLQLTGKDSYREASEILRGYNSAAPDFVQDPDQVITTEWCVEVAAAEWRSKGCNDLADQDQIRAVTKKINGGLIGLAERQEWLKRTKNIWL